MPKPYVYVTCPDCGRRIEEPFSRYSGPVVFVHSHARRRNARLLIVPDIEGHRHRVHQVPQTMSLETALEHAIGQEAA